MARFLFEVTDADQRVVVRSFAKNPASRFLNIINKYNEETRSSEEMINYSIRVILSFEDLKEVKAYRKVEKVTRVNLFEPVQTVQ